MKLLIVGDMHFRLDLPYGSAFPDGRKKEWENVLSKLVELASPCEGIVLMGDVLNARHNHSSVNAALVNFMTRFGDKQIYVISGNHCRYGEKTGIDFLKETKHPNWHIYTEIQGGVPLGNMTATFVPYLTPSMVGAEDKETGIEKALEKIPEGDVAFFHQGIAGAKVHGSMVDLFNEIVFPKEALEKKFKKIFSGHVHQAQKIGKKIQMTGSLFTMEVGEHDKQVFTYDTETNLTETISVPLRGIYGVKDKESLSEIPDNSIVKYVVTDKTIEIEKKKEELERFDASFIVENYPSERKKVSVENGTLAFDLDSLLTMYALQRKIEYTELKEALTLLD